VVVSDEGDSNRSVEGDDGLEEIGEPGMTGSCDDINRPAESLGGRLDGFGIRWVAFHNRLEVD